jgi:trk system potassium uptake protein TrkH
VLLVTAWRVLSAGAPVEPAFREALFNLTSIMTGTGFFSGSFGGWGGFALAVAFALGLCGGCSGSSSGAMTVFRVQVILSAVAAALRRIANPSRIALVRYDGRPVPPDAMSGIIFYANGYLVTLGVLSVALTLTGADTESALFAVWTSMGNIGYGFGAMVARTGTFVDFTDEAKLVMILAMLLGRLGLLAVFVVVFPRFWRG